jgi:hypothetical protein
MRRRWTADQITRLLKEADRDLAKKLTVSDTCRKHSIDWKDMHFVGRIGQKSTR